jgi:hypothetical protein
MGEGPMDDHENTLGVDWHLLQVKEDRIYDQMQAVLNAREGLWMKDLRELIDELLQAEAQYAAKEERKEQEAFPPEFDTPVPEEGA